jgi:hypothetical protein
MASNFEKLGGYVRGKANEQAGNFVGGVKSSFMGVAPEAFGAMGQGIGSVRDILKKSGKAAETAAAAAASAEKKRTTKEDNQQSFAEESKRENATVEKEKLKTFRSIDESLKDILKFLTDPKNSTNNMFDGFKAALSKFALATSGLIAALKALPAGLIAALKNFKISVPKWLKDFKISVPKWLKDFKISVPKWLKDFKIGVPKWLKDFKVSTPKWISKLDTFRMSTPKWVTTLTKALVVARGIRPNQLLDKNGNPLKGAARTARAAKITRETGAVIKTGGMFTGVGGKVAGSIGGIGSKITGSFDVLNGKLASMFDDIFVRAYVYFDDAIKAFTSSKLGQVLVKIGPKVGSILNKLFWPLIALDGLMEAFNTESLSVSLSKNIEDVNLVDRLSGFLAGIVGAIPDLLLQLGTWMVSKITGIDYDELLPDDKMFTRFFTRYFDGLFTVISGIQDKILGFFTGDEEKSELGGAKLELIGAKFTDFLGDVRDVIVRGFFDVLNGVSLGVQEAFASAKAAFGEDGAVIDLVKDMKEFFVGEDSIFSNISDFFSEVFEAIGNVIGDTLVAIKDYFIDSISSIAKNAKDLATGKVSLNQVIMGADFSNPINDAVRSVGSFIGTSAANIVSGTSGAGIISTLDAADATRNAKVVTAQAKVDAQAPKDLATTEDNIAANEENTVAVDTLAETITTTAEAGKAHDQDVLAAKAKQDAATLQQDASLKDNFLKLQQQANGEHVRGIAQAACGCVGGSRDGGGGNLKDQIMGAAMGAATNYATDAIGGLFGGGNTSSAATPGFAGGLGGILEGFGNEITGGFASVTDTFSNLGNIFGGKTSSGSVVGGGLGGAVGGGSVLPDGGMIQEDATNLGGTGFGGQVAGYAANYLGNMAMEKLGLSGPVAQVGSQIIGNTVMGIAKGGSLVSSFKGSISDFSGAGMANGSMMGTLGGVMSFANMKNMDFSTNAGIAGGALNMYQAGTFLQGGGFTTAATNATTAMGGSASTGAAIGGAANIAAGAYGGVMAGRALSGGYAAGGGSGNSAVNTGVAIGSIAGPVGSLVGGLIGGAWNRAFGRKAEEIVGKSMKLAVGEDDSSGTHRTDMKQKGGWFRSDRLWNEQEDIDSEISNWLSESATTMNREYSAIADSIGLNTSSMRGFIGNYDVDITDLNQDQVSQKLVETMGQYASDAVSTTANFKQYALAGEKATDTLVRLADSVGDVDYWFQALGNTAAQTDGALIKALTTQFTAEGMVNVDPASMSKTRTEVIQLFSQGDLAEFGGGRGRGRGGYGGMSISRTVNKTESEMQNDLVLAKANEAAKLVAIFGGKEAFGSSMQKIFLTLYSAEEQAEFARKQAALQSAAALANLQGMDPELMAKLNDLGIGDLDTMAKVDAAKSQYKDMINAAQKSGNFEEFKRLSDGVDVFLEAAQISLTAAEMQSDADGGISGLGGIYSMVDTGSSNFGIGSGGGSIAVGSSGQTTTYENMNDFITAGSGSGSGSGSAIVAAGGGFGVGAAGNNTGGAIVANPIVVDNSTANNATSNITMYNDSVRNSHPILDIDVRGTTSGFLGIGSR